MKLTVRFLSGERQVALSDWAIINEIEVSLDLTDPQVAKEIKTLVENCEALEKNE